MKGKAIIFSAPSGAGKTTVVHALLSRIPLLRFSISITTRAERATEIEGQDYYFLSVDEFKAKQAAGDLLEWGEIYAGTYYGTLKSEVERIWNEGHHVVFDVDVQGGLKLKIFFRDKALSIFIKPPSHAILKKRLQNRNTESDETLQIRVDKAVIELIEEEKFDEVVVNDVLDKTIKKMELLVKDFIRK